MKRVFTRLSLLFILLTPLSAFAGSGFSPAGQPEYDFLYDRFERLEANSLDRFDYQLGPYRLDRIDSVIGPFAWLTQLSDHKIATFAYAGESLRAARLARGHGYASLRGGIAAQPSAKLYINANLILDEQRAKDPTYTGKKWRGFAGDIENAWANYQTGGFDLTLGRFASFWGNRRSLVLGDNAPMDGLAYSYRWGRLTISYRLGQLRGLDPAHDSVPDYVNRYFAGHRFDLHFSNSIRAGIFETIVFGGPGRPIDLYYLNPLIFFHGAQLNEGHDDNSSVGLDFSVKPRQGCNLYGQLLIDDFQFDRKTQGDQKPNMYGLQAGGYFADVIPSLDIRAEYSRVSNWTFNQRLKQNRYLYDNRLISAALGDDYDLTTISAFRWFGDQKCASLNLRLWRQGEGSVTAPWTEPWLQVVGSYSEKFPTGVVQTTFTSSLGFKGFLFDHIFIDGEAGLDFVRNLGHVNSDNRTLPFVNLRISAFSNAIVSME
ncbi:MAG TPA: capsule assembly Wzi family protein [Candidatus Acidoferrum sp.]|nr:capsule assembly Wzi family protein [Candidatus Acidoferrum sp.]